MIELDVPGRGALRLAHLVLDYNGTLAVDGVLLPGVAERLARLAEALQVHVVTADTFGRAAAGLSGLECTLTVLPPGGQTMAKRQYVEALGADTVVAMGNGANDQEMLRAAALGVVLIQAEGAAVVSLQAADVVCTGIVDGLDLLLCPLRLKASLRA